MTKYVEMLAAILIACASGSAAATICENQPIGDEGGESCGEPGGGGGSGGTPPTYTLQGVIQNEGNERNSNGWLFAHIRGYSRLADANNDRVDADFISVYCVTYGPGTSDDYDDEHNGALVDVHFYSAGVPRGGVNTVTVQCTHHAEKNGVQYDTTSTTQIPLNNFP